MGMRVRRVVTGHDPHGRAIVKADNILENIAERRPGVQSCVVWSTATSPADNSDEEDRANHPVGITMRGGTVFRIITYQPGITPRRHRTLSVDYAIVLSGAIDMELDDTVVHLSAGDVLVQRGTVHSWVNRGPDPCTIAFVLVDAKPVVIADKTLGAEAAF